MSKVIIQDEFTSKNPITMIGKEAGCCWGADTSDDKKNYKRGIDCLESEHGRTFEFPDVYMILPALFVNGIRTLAVPQLAFRQVHGTSTMSMALIL